MIAIIAGLALNSAPEFVFDVSVTGKGRPVLLIPDFACGPTVWKSTVEELSQNNYQCHVFTLPGFAGKKPKPPPLLVPICKDIIRYVQTKKLDHPIFVGHGLGGSLALWLNSTWPKLFGGCLSIEGAPWAPGLGQPNLRVANIAKTAQGLKSTYARMGMEPWKQCCLGTMMASTADPATAQLMCAESCKSDPGAVGQAMAELMQIDLRPIVKAITVPTEVIVGTKAFDDDRQASDLLAQYADQMKPVTGAKVVGMRNSFRFPMLDEPTAYMYELRRFLATTRK